jgi:hypothetical protein
MEYRDKNLMIVEKIDVLKDSKLEKIVEILEETN